MKRKKKRRRPCVDSTKYRDKLLESMRRTAQMLAEKHSTEKPN